MVNRAPFARGEPRLECRDCDYRTAEKSHPPTCPSCGGGMRTAPAPNEPS